MKHGEVRRRRKRESRSTTRHWRTVTPSDKSPANPGFCFIPVLAPQPVLPSAQARGLARPQTQHDLRRKHRRLLVLRLGSETVRGEGRLSRTYVSLCVSFATRSHQYADKAAP